MEYINTRIKIEDIRCFFASFIFTCLLMVHFCIIITRVLYLFDPTNLNALH